MSSAIHNQGPIKTTLACAVLTSAALANHYVVDDAPGPGVDFVGIEAAVAAAVDGDVLIIRPGSYAAIDLSEALTLVCDAGAFAPSLRVHHVPIDRVAVVSGLETFEVDVQSCAGTVVLQHISAIGYGLSAPGVSPVCDVSGSWDVRVYRSAFLAKNRWPGSNSSAGDTAVRVATSRVEFVRCNIRGGGQGEAAPIYPQPYQVGAGGVGMELLSGAMVRVALSDVRGGDGADVPPAYIDVQSGNGGPAIRVNNQSSVVVAGTRGQSIQGGPRGALSLYGTQGFDAPALYVAPGGSARASGCIFRGGSNTPPFLGTVTQASPPDPTADRMGNGSAGAALSVRVYGPTGVAPILERGTTPEMTPSGGPVPKLVVGDAAFALPTIPSNLGAAELTTTIPSGDPVGKLYLWQVTGQVAVGAIVFSNSVPVVVR